MQTYALAITLTPEGISDFQGGEDAQIDRSNNRVVFKNVLDHSRTPDGGLKVICNPEHYEFSRNAWLTGRKASEARELVGAVAR